MAVTRLTRKQKNGKRTTFFMADVYVNGQKVTSKSFTVRAEAEVWHNETKAQWTSGSQGAAKGQHEEKTFGDCLNDYLSDSEGFGRLRLSSQQSMEARLDHFLKSPVVSVRMNDFGAGTIDAWFDWILQQPTAEAKGRKSFRIELKCSCKRHYLFFLSSIG